VLSNFHPKDILFFAVQFNLNLRVKTLRELLLICYIDSA